MFAGIAEICFKKSAQDIGRDVEQAMSGRSVANFHEVARALKINAGCSDDMRSFREMMEIVEMTDEATFSIQAGQVVLHHRCLPC